MIGIPFSLECDSIYYRDSYNVQRINVNRKSFLQPMSTLSLSLFLSLYFCITNTGCLMCTKDVGVNSCGPATCFQFAISCGSMIGP